MKKQYLGDSKDSFKWDYHDYLTTALKYPVLNIALMMTPDDNSREGKTPSKGYPAKDSIIEFCHELREHPEIDRIIDLPKKTGSDYEVALHKKNEYFENTNRSDYFFGFGSDQDQIVFLDPDNGLEPKKSTKKHVRYSDITKILGQISSTSIISIFHHFRHISFPDDYAQIQKHIKSGYSSAIYWHSLMFVLISNSEQSIRQVELANNKYAESKPVRVITHRKCSSKPLVSYQVKFFRDNISGKQVDSVDKLLF